MTLEEELIQLRQEIRVLREREGLQKIVGSFHSEAGLTAFCRISS
jgi:hypothetical protein